MRSDKTVVRLLQRKGGAMQIVKYGRFWAVYDDKDELVCVTVYKKGAEEVVKRILKRGQA